MLHPIEARAAIHVMLTADVPDLTRTDVLGLTALRLGIECLPPGTLTDEDRCAVFVQALDALSRLYPDAVWLAGFEDGRVWSEWWRLSDPYCSTPVQATADEERRRAAIRAVWDTFLPRVDHDEETRAYKWAVRSSRRGRRRPVGGKRLDAEPEVVTGCAAVTIAGTAASMLVRDEAGQFHMHGATFRDAIERQHVREVGVSGTDAPDTSGREDGAGASADAEIIRGRAARALRDLRDAGDLAAEAAARHVLGEAGMLPSVTLAVLSRETGIALSTIHGATGRARSALASALAGLRDAV